MLPEAKAKDEEKQTLTKICFENVDCIKSGFLYAKANI